MSDALDRFNQMLVHIGECFNNRVVKTDPYRLVVGVECDCGVIWEWRLTELKMRQPEGYVERLFQDVTARQRLACFVNGTILIENERRIR